MHCSPFFCTAGSVALSRALNRLERRLYTLCADLATIGAAKTVSQVLSVTTVLATGIDVLDACNYKALLTSGWSNPLRAVLHLRKSQLAYAAVHRCLSECLPPGLHAFVTLPVSTSPLQQESKAAGALQSVSLAIAPGCAPLSVPSLRVLAQRMRSAMVTLEALATHSCFFRVQVLSQLSQGRAAAAAVEELLMRQLKHQLPFMLKGEPSADSAGGSGSASQAALVPTGDAPAAASWDEAPDIPAHIARNLDMHAAGTGDVEPLNALEWSRHSMRLSDYYSNRGLYTQAAYCLTAADIMLDRETARRVALQTKAAAGSSSSVQGGSALPAPPSEGVKGGAAAASPPELPAKAAAVQDGPLLQEEGFRQAKALSRMHWGMLHTAILKDARDTRLSEMLQQPLEGMPQEDPAEPIYTEEQLQALRESKGGQGGAAAGAEPNLYNEGVLGALSESHRGLDLPTPPPVQASGISPVVNVPSVANVGSSIELVEAEALLQDKEGVMSRGDGLATQGAPFQDFITENEVSQTGADADGGKATVSIQLPKDLNSTCSR